MVVKECAWGWPRAIARCQYYSAGVYCLVHVMWGSQCALWGRKHTWLLTSAGLWASVKGPDGPGTDLRCHFVQAYAYGYNLYTVYFFGIKNF
jgi:hypothetical protein